MAIGSETGGGVMNVLVRNISATVVGNAARVKSARGRGGLIQVFGYMFNLLFVFFFGQFIDLLPIRRLQYSAVYLII